MARVLTPAPEGQAIIGAERPSRSNRERPAIRIGSKAALDAPFRIERVFLARIRYVVNIKHEMQTITYASLRPPGFDQCMRPGMI